MLLYKVKEANCEVGFFCVYILICIFTLKKYFFLFYYSIFFITFATKAKDNKYFCSKKVHFFTFYIKHITIYNINTNIELIQNIKSRVIN